MQSYRCLIRTPNTGTASDPDLQESVQLKANNAVDAMRRANLVTGKAVISAERLDSACLSDRAA